MVTIYYYCEVLLLYMYAVSYILLWIHLVYTNYSGVLAT